MAIYVYNTKQQALTSKKIAELFSFTLNDFGGLISNVENPILFDSTESKKSWNWAVPTPVELVGGGLKIECDVNSSDYTFNNDSSCYHLYGLDITVPSSDSSILNNKFTERAANIIQLDCEEIEKKSLYIVVNYPSGNPSTNQYYEYSSQGSEENGEYILSEDTEVDDNKVYYYLLPNYSYTITNAIFNRSTDEKYTFDYYGNTVWLPAESSDMIRFFIPICSIDKEGNMDCMIFNRDKTGYESFLTARTYYHLLQELGNKFVFREGGPTKGDIGDLNITDNIIKNKENINNGVNIIKPILDIDESVVPDLDHILFIDKDTKRVYKTKDDYTIPIKHGGTSANQELDARKNLGFTYGPDDPTITPKRINGDIDEGAVYFKLLRD